MDDYRSNSNRAREQGMVPRQRVEKVTSGTVSQRRKNGLEKLLGGLFSTDADSIGEYILYDVLIPTIRRTFYDIICNSTGMLLGERSPSRGNNNASRVSYRAYYDRRDGAQNDRSGNQRRANCDYSDLIFDSRGDAEVVLERMYEILERFDAVSVADLFDLAGQSSSYTENKYGWTNLDNARVQPVRGGYIIQLPRATML